MKDRKVVGIDIDGILTTKASPYDGDWRDMRPRDVEPLLACAKPNYDMIRIVNSIYEAGHDVKIWTARAEEYRQVTKLWLDVHRVKYHDLWMGKKHVNIMIDDKATNNSDELMRYLGIEDD